MTLTELAVSSRIVAKLTLVFAAGSLVFYLLIMIMVQSLTPKRGPAVSLSPSFGKIERPVFEAALEKKSFDFVLDTVDGVLPPATSSAVVYFMPAKQATLLYLTKANALATSFNINTEIYPQQTIDDSWVKFTSPTDELRVNTKYFHFTYNMLASPELQSIVETTPSARFTQLEDRFVQVAKDALTRRDAYTTDLAAGKTNIVYLRYDVLAKKYIPITSDEIPQAVRIDFFRKDESLSVVTASYFTSQNYVILAPLIDQAKVVAMQYKSFDKMDGTTGSYPLISPAQAWEALEKNDVSIVSLQEQASGTIKIKQLFLSYYDPESYQQYFQPIYVFLGDKNFVGYYPAVDPKYFIDSPITQ